MFDNRAPCMLFGLAIRHGFLLKKCVAIESGSPAIGGNQPIDGNHWAAGVDKDLAKSSPPPLRCILWFWRFSGLSLVLVLSPAIIVILIDLSIILFVDAIGRQTSGRSSSKDGAAIGAGSDV
jgi:hypothetical protein